jgi:hypothetical protein
MTPEFQLAAPLAAFPVFGARFTPLAAFPVFAALVRRGDVERSKRCAGRSAGAHRRGEEKGPRRVFEVSGFEANICVLRVFFTEYVLRRSADLTKSDRLLQQAEHSVEP